MSLHGNEERKSWYRRWWGIVLAIIIWPYFLTWYVWKKTSWHKAAKGLVTVPLAFAMLMSWAITAATFNGSSSSNNSSAVGTQSSQTGTSPRPSNPAMTTTSEPRSIATPASQPPPASPAATTTISATPNANSTTPSTSPPVPANNLTGYGATQDQWNATHIADTKFMPDSAYNPGYSSAGCSGDGDEYYAMNGTLYYSMCLNRNNSQQAAQSLVMREFPNDTTVLWQGKQTSGEPNECYQMEVHSPTLEAVLGNSGDVLVEFQTFDPINSSGNIEYNSSNVNNILLSGQDNASLSAAPGC